MQSFTCRAGWMLACLLIANPVAAQVTEDTSIAAARALGKSGVELFQAGDIPAALEKLQRAYALYEAPTLGLWYARALERSGRLVEASERYRQVSLAPLAADATPAFRQAQADAKLALDGVLPRLPQLTIEAPGLAVAQLRLSLDDVQLNAAVIGVPLPVNPGVHVLRATLGTQVFEDKLELKEAEPLRSVITLPPEPVAEPAVVGKSRLQPEHASARVAAPVPRAEILKVMQAMLPQIGACAHGISGKAVASVTIRGATGHVEDGRVQLDAELVKRLMPSPQLSRERMVELYESCMLRVVESAHFPRFEAPQLQLEYPYHFAPAPAQQKDGERPVSAAR